MKNPQKTKHMHLIALNGDVILTCDDDEFSMSYFREENIVH